MSKNRYEGRIKVVCDDMMCFPADPVTLKGLGESCYDPYAVCDPEQGPVETILYQEWIMRRSVIRYVYP